MSSSSASPSPPPRDPQKKRKKVEQDGDELEIDVNLPEPPSKKAKRKEQKLAKKKASQPATTGTEAEATADGASAGNGTIHSERQAQIETEAPKDGKAKRSEYGVWIGNLSFPTTKDNLRTFLREKGEITEADIMRLHMPAPPDKSKNGPAPAIKPQNKGFAYVDFTTKDKMDQAIALSEKLLNGRKLLIKNAKSFEGRPEKPRAEEGGNATAAAVGGKEPSKRVFVGNLSFDVSKEDLKDHFEQAGEVEDVHMATFEDSGKCKGYAWITFATLEASKAAVEGYVYKAQEQEDEGDEDASEEGDDSEGEQKSKKSKSKKKKKKPMKWFINRLFGRPLRCEFAEDSQTRYKKRFGAGAKARGGEENGDASASNEVTGGNDANEAAPFKAANKPKNLSKEDRQEERRKRHEAKSAAASAPQISNKASGAGVVGTGKKITFD